MSDISGRVLEIKRSADTRYAYLYRFRINRADLRGSHKTWLDMNLIAPAQLDAQPPVQLPIPPTLRLLTWHVWLCGTTSRTGNWADNHLLSARRANAVAAYVEAACARRGIKLQIHKGWIGEVLATLKGRPNDFEHPLDRAVLIAFKPVPPAPAPVQPPPPVAVDLHKNNPCCYLRQQIEYITAVLETFVLILARGRPGSPPRQGLGGDLYGTSDVPRVTLDSLEQYWLQSLLQGKGWSGERARELSQDSTYTVIRIDGLEDHINRLGRELTYLKDLLGNKKCSDHDPVSVCQTGHFRKHNTDPDAGSEPRQWRRVVTRSGEES